LERVPHHVVIVGAGFGGLEAARALAGAGVRVTIIDRRNHHLFQPLLYQVATASLAPSEIAWPIRHLMRRRKDVTTLLATVTGVDKSARKIALQGSDDIAFDTLVLATGATHAYFGHDEWAACAPSLKTLEDATTIRGRILLAFEEAEREPDAARRAALLTFVVIGGGPTGVELAGTIAELAHHNLRNDFRNFDARTSRVVLIEAGPRVLPSFAKGLSAYTRRVLEKLGVEVELGHPVRDCDAKGVEFDGHRLEAATILWAAGVKASPAANWVDAPADHAHRVKVESDLSVPGHPEIFVIGDTATIDAWHGKPVPGIAPAAKQQGRHVARIVKARLRGDIRHRPFQYKHSGSLATIGKRAAVIDFGWIRLRGWLAWCVWGIAHIYFLIGLRNRLAVTMNWLWIYATGNRSARLIPEHSCSSERRLLHDEDTAPKD
jgi:NADH dehydrogenase